MKVDLNRFIQGEQENQTGQREQLSKEEYAAMKKQEREEVWAQVDGTAQDIFKDGKSLKGFLDFVAQCRPQKAANLLLLYSQNPDIRQVKTFERWRAEKAVIRKGEQGYKFITGQEYEKDGISMTGTKICNVYDISQVRTRQIPTPKQRGMDELMKALLTNPMTPVRIADNLPEKVQAQYVPDKWTIYVRNGMSETTTFHAINREMACASMDRHNGTYNRGSVTAQAFCAAYVVAQKYGVDVSGFSFDQVCGYQNHGDKDPKELRGFVAEISNAAYTIEKHMDRNLKEKVQEFSEDAFNVSDGKSTEKPDKAKEQQQR